MDNSCNFHFSVLFVAADFDIVDDDAADVTRRRFGIPHKAVSAPEPQLTLTLTRHDELILVGVLTHVVNLNFASHFFYLLFSFCIHSIILLDSCQAFFLESWELFSRFPVGPVVRALALLGRHTPRPAAELEVSLKLFSRFLIHALIHCFLSFALSDTIIAQPGRFVNTFL